MKSYLGLRCVPVACAIVLTLLLPSVQATEANFNCSQDRNCASNVAFARLDPAFGHSTDPSSISNSTEVITTQTFKSNVIADIDSVQVVEPNIVSNVAGSIQTFSLPGNQYGVQRAKVAWNSVPPVIQRWLNRFSDQDSIVVEFRLAAARNENPKLQKIVQAESDTFPTPEPVSFALLGSGLIIIGGVFWRRLRK